MIKKIFVNFSNNITKIEDKILDSESIIFSQFKSDKFKNNDKKHSYSYLPWGYNPATTLNNFFWIYSNKKEKFKDVEEIIFLNINEKIKDYVDNKTIECLSEKKENILSIKKNKKGYYISVKTKGKKDIFKPAISFYNKDVSNIDLDFFLGWLYEMSKEFSCNFKIKEEKAYPFYKSENLIKILKKKRKILYEKENNKKVINAGNEGVIFKLNTSEKLTKEFYKTWKGGFFTEKEWKLAKNEIETHNKLINLKKTEESDEKISFSFDPKLLPTNSLTYPDLIFSLKEQWKGKYLIDDNKLENYAKYHIIGSIFIAVHNDFGYSYLKMKNYDEGKYLEAFRGIIRDNFYLAKKYRNRNLREIIKDRRNIPLEELFKKDHQLEIFMDFALKFDEKSQNQKKRVYPCHEKISLSEIKKWNIKEINICNKNAKTMFIKRKENYFFDILKKTKGQCHACVEKINKDILKLVDLESKTNDYERGEDLFCIVDSYKYKLKD